MFVFCFDLFNLMTKINKLYKNLEHVHPLVEDKDKGNNVALQPKTPPNNPIKQGQVMGQPLPTPKTCANVSHDFFFVSHM